MKYKVEIEKEINSNDPNLEMFVEIANNKGLDMNVTLFTNGQVISGTLIGHNKYLELVVEGFKNSDNEHGIIIGEYFEKMIDKMIEEESSINYIHLKDQRILNLNEQNDITQQMPLRLKFSSVIGFKFGA